MSDDILRLERDGYVLTDDRAAVDLGVVHGFLKTAYWAEGVDATTVARAIAHSHPFVLLRDGAQAGFARVVTDYAAMAYVMDVFVLPEHRRRGLAQWMMESMLAHPRLKDVGLWRLATRDMHELYTKVGFGPLRTPERMMERFAPEHEPAQAAQDGGSA